MSMHHVAVDGWSAGVLAEDFEAAYHRAVGTTAAGGTQPVAQYADYARRQAQRLADGEFEPHIAYWNNKLKGARPVSLPPFVTRCPGKPGDARARCITRDIDRQVVAALGRLSVLQRTTVFSCLLAAVGLYLAKACDDADVAIPTMFANRLHPEFRRAVGFMATPLLLRLNVERASSWREIVSQAHRSASEALRYQEVPYQMISAVAQDPEERRGPTLLLEFGNMPDWRLRLPGVSVSPVGDRQGPGATFDVELHFFIYDETWRLRAVFLPSRVDEAGVERLVEELVAAIDACATEAA